MFIDTHCHLNDSKYDNIDLVISEINKLGIKELVVPNNLNNSIKNSLTKIYGILLSINEDLTVDSYLEGITKNLNSLEVVAALIEEKDTFVEGIKYVQEVIDGSASLMFLFENEHLIVARDKYGRLPISIGKNNDGFCVSLEPFAYEKLGYVPYKELKSGEIVEISNESVTILEKGSDEMKICSFLWAYYGYPTATYEGKNVEMFRMNNGKVMAQNEKANGTLPNVDYISGVPDSGTPHAIGYSNESGIPFARPFIKYTPAWARSFTPSNQEERKKVAKMKQIPIIELIKGKNMLLLDDSIVRGTQLNETVDFLFKNGAKSVHMRSACPPIMYACKYINFSRNNSDMDLLGRRIIMELEGEEGFKYIDEYADSSTERGKKFRESICKKMKFDSLEYQSLDGFIKALGVEPCKLCTYCWNGKEK